MNIEKIGEIPFKSSKMSYYNEKLYTASVKRVDIYSLTGELVGTIDDATRLKTDITGINVDNNKIFVLMPAEVAIFDVDTLEYICSLGNGTSYMAEHTYGFSKGYNTVVSDGWVFVRERADILAYKESDIAVGKTPSELLIKARTIRGDIGAQGSAYNGNLVKYEGLIYSTDLNRAYVAVIDPKEVVEGAPIAIKDTIPLDKAKPTSIGIVDGTLYVKYSGMHVETYDLVTETKIREGIEVNGVEYLEANSVTSKDNVLVVAGKDIVEVFKFTKSEEPVEQVEIGRYHRVVLKKKTETDIFDPSLKKRACATEDAIYILGGNGLLVYNLAGEKIGEVDSPRTTTSDVKGLHADNDYIYILYPALLDVYDRGTKKFVCSIGSGQSWRDPSFQFMGAGGVYSNDKYVFIKGKEHLYAYKKSDIAPGKVYNDMLIAAKTADGAFVLDSYKRQSQLCESEGMLYAIDSEGKKIVVVDMSKITDGKTIEVEATMDIPNGIVAHCIDIIEDRLYLTKAHDEVFVYNKHTMELLDEVEGFVGYQFTSTITDVGVVPNKDMAYAYDSGVGKLVIGDIVPGDIVRKAPAKDELGVNLTRDELPAEAVVNKIFNDETPREVLHSSRYFFKVANPIKVISTEDEFTIMNFVPATLYDVTIVGTLAELGEEVIIAHIDRLDGHDEIILPPLNEIVNGFKVLGKDEELDYTEFLSHGEVPGFETTFLPSNPKLEILKSIKVAWEIRMWDYVARSNGKPKTPCEGGMWINRPNIARLFSAMMLNTAYVFSTDIFKEKWYASPSFKIDVETGERYYFTPEEIDTAFTDIINERFYGTSCMGGGGLGGGYVLGIAYGALTNAIWRYKEGIEEYYDEYWLPESVYWQKSCQAVTVHEMGHCIKHGHNSTFCSRKDRDGDSKFIGSVVIAAIEYSRAILNRTLPVNRDEYYMPWDIETTKPHCSEPYEWRPLRVRGGITGFKKSKVIDLSRYDELKPVQEITPEKIYTVVTEAGKTYMVILDYDGNELDRLQIKTKGPYSMHIANGRLYITGSFEVLVYKLDTLEYITKIGDGKSATSNIYKGASTYVDNGYIFVETIYKLMAFKEEDIDKGYSGLEFQAVAECPIDNTYHMRSRMIKIGDLIYTRQMRKQVTAFDPRSVDEGMFATKAEDGILIDIPAKYLTLDFFEDNILAISSNKVIALDYKECRPIKTLNHLDGEEYDDVVSGRGVVRDGKSYLVLTGTDKNTITMLEVVKDGKPTL